MSSRIIYGLVDLISGQVRYIGRSSSGLKRPRAHDDPCRLRDESHKTRWIRRLLAKGLRYEIKVLESDVQDLNAREQHWIAYGRKKGWPLTNLTDGGFGLNGYRFSGAHRRKISRALTGRRLSEDHCRKIAEIRSAAPADAQRIRKMNKAWRGKHHSGEAKRLISLGQAGKVVSAGGRESISQHNSKAVKDLTTGKIYASQKVAAEAFACNIRCVNRTVRGIQKTLRSHILVDA